jgi:phosphopantothenoylcysteine synthetase/decarboxylase
MRRRPILITAGATRNPVDAIRYLSSHAGGGTAAWLADRLADCGPITVFGNPEALLRAPVSVLREEYGGTLDLLERMERWVTAHPDGVLLHSAAVGDYAVEATPSKIPSGQAEIVLRLRPTPKIVDRVKAWSPRTFLVSFKAAAPETTALDLAGIATAQRLRTSSDLVFGNVIGALGSRLLIADEGGVEHFEDRTHALEALVSRLRARAFAS